jgi:transcription initiation factor TFIIIB Brf1 subunit/transcription initiation factor TFIIB
LRHDGGLGTELHPIRNKTRYSPAFCARWPRLIRHNNQIRGKARRLRNVICEVARVCSYMGLPHIARDRMCWMLKKFKGKEYTLGILADLVYTTCRSLSAPRTLEEIDKA